jgi:predicted phosphodiesterase
MAQFEPDHVIVAGDLINVGPFSPQVMARVTELGWATIRGNHEHYLLEYNTPRQPDSRRGWITLPYLYAQLEGHWYNHIAAMPDELTLLYPDGPPIRVLHGIPGNPFVSLDRHSSAAKVRQAYQGIEESLVISGHYHLSFEKWVDHWHAINPGSVGLPLDGRPDASYVILDSVSDMWQATFRRVPVDYTPLYAEFEQQHFVENCGVIAYLIIQQFKTSRTVINAFERWQAANCPDESVTIALVDTFLESGQMRAYISPYYRYNLHLLD